MAEDAGPGTAAAWRGAADLAAAPGFRGRFRAGLARSGRAATFGFPFASRGRLREALTLEAERGALFLCVPVLLGLGAVLYFKAPFEPHLALLLCLAAAAAAAAALLRARRGAFFCLAALGLCLCGMVAGKLETARLSTKMLGSEVTTRITGKVLRVDRLAGARMRLLIDVSATAQPRLRFAPDRVRVTTAKPIPGARAGAVVKGLVRLMPPSGPAMPGGYDFSFQSYFDGIGASGFFLGTPQIEPLRDDGPLSPSWIENLRDRIAQRVRGRVGGAEGEIAAALIVGVRGGIPESVNEALRRTGLAHVLSISGLHMALVAAIGLGGARALLACFPGFASRRPVKKLAAAAALLLTCAYLALSGADVAAVRSFVMLAVMLAAVLFDRAALSVRNLAIAAAIIILVWPHEVLGPSFQMSFAATGALVAVYAAWSGRRMDREGRPPDRSPFAWALLRRGGAAAGGLAATSLIAGAATAVFGIYHFQRASPLSLPANLAAMPLVSVLVMPPALFAVLTMPFGVDGPFLAVVGFGLRAMIGVAQWFSDRSPIDAVGSIPLASLLLIVAALIGFTLTSTRLRYFLLPLPALAAILAVTAHRADVFVSEDGRLVGVALADGRLAVSSARGGGFTLENWIRASAASAVVRPPRTASPDAEPAFACGSSVCTLQLANGATVVHAGTAQAAASTCGKADILIVANATAKPCEGNAGRTTVLTKRDLAMQGSAALDFGTGSPTSNFSVPLPLRPWHDHRRFSRAARGLPDVKPPRAGRTSARSATNAE